MNEVKNAMEGNNSKIDRSVKPPGRQQRCPVFWNILDSALKAKGMLLDVGPLPPRKTHSAGQVSGVLKQRIPPWMCHSNSFAG